MTYIAISAGAALWPVIRSVAAMNGLTIEESRGWFRRSFVLCGTASQLQQAASELLKIEGFSQCD